MSFAAESKRRCAYDFFFLLVTRILEPYPVTSIRSFSRCKLHLYPLRTNIKTSSKKKKFRIKRYNNHGTYDFRLLTDTLPLFPFLALVGVVTEAVELVLFSAFKEVDFFIPPVGVPVERGVIGTRAGALLFWEVSYCAGAWVTLVPFSSRRSSSSRASSVRVS